MLAGGRSSGQAPTSGDSTPDPDRDRDRDPTVAGEVGDDPKEGIVPSATRTKASPAPGPSSAGVPEAFPGGEEAEVGVGAGVGVGVGVGAGAGAEAGAGAGAGEAALRGGTGPSTVADVWGLVHRVRQQREQAVAERAAKRPRV